MSHWSAARAIAAAAVAAVVALPAAAEAKTTHCPGSLSDDGRYLPTSKEGDVRDYYIRNGSCAAARALLLIAYDVGPITIGRGGSAIERLKVSGGSVWKCRSKIDDPHDHGGNAGASRGDQGVTRVYLRYSCRPLTGRLNRRVTARIRDHDHEDGEI